MQEKTRLIWHVLLYVYNNGMQAHLKVIVLTFLKTIAFYLAPTIYVRGLYTAPTLCLIKVHSNEFQSFFLKSICNLCMTHAMKGKLGLSKLGVIRDNKLNASLMRRSRHFYDAFETEPQTCFVSRLIEKDGISSFRLGFYSSRVRLVYILFYSFRLHIDVRFV